ncbi:GNAT family N-acetyltransferase [Paenibacillus sp. CAU 1782]
MKKHGRIQLKPLEMDDASALLQLRLENEAYLKPFEPVRDQRFLSLEGQMEHIAAGLESMRLGQSLPMGIRHTETGALIGRIELSGIARGPFQNAYLGYFINHEHSGKGLMTEAVYRCIEIAFRELGLHRIQAAVMPVNKASSAVLEKCGFRQEGLARRYLHINGKWEDHFLYAVTNDDN